MESKQGHCDDTVADGFGVGAEGGGVERTCTCGGKLLARVAHAQAVEEGGVTLGVVAKVLARGAQTEPHDLCFAKRGLQVGDGLLGQRGGVVDSGVSLPKVFCYGYAVELCNGFASLADESLDLGSPPLVEGTHRTLSLRSLYI